MAESRGRESSADRIKRMSERGRDSSSERGRSGMATDMKGPSPESMRNCERLPRRGNEEDKPFSDRLGD